MRQQVTVRPMGPREFAAEVREGQEVTHHRIVLSDELLDELLPLRTDERQVTVESINYLLDEMPGSALPHDIDLDRLRHTDARYLTELQDRLSG